MTGDPTRRIPLIPTIVVAAAVAAMIALGLWQLLDRWPKKEAFLAQLAANPARPPIAFPMAPDESLLFRRAYGYCLPPITTRLAGAGAAGFRVIATCRTGRERPDMQVQLGTSRDPKARVDWRGGTVEGRIAHAPDGRSLIGTLLNPTALAMMLVLDPPAAGLSPNPPVDGDAVPNNHLAYAGQWFFFAAVAAIIYAVALRRRQRSGGAMRRGTAPDIHLR